MFIITAKDRPGPDWVEVFARYIVLASTKQLVLSENGKAFRFWMKAG